MNKLTKKGHKKKQCEECGKFYYQLWVRKGKWYCFNCHQKVIKILPQFNIQKRIKQVIRGDKVDFR